MFMLQLLLSGYLMFSATKHILLPKCFPARYDPLPSMKVNGAPKDPSSLGIMYMVSFINKTLLHFYDICLNLA